MLVVESIKTLYISCPEAVRDPMKVRPAGAAFDARKI
jgi:hypothetical protein